MIDLRALLGLEHLVFQAGLGGGLAGSDLAAAVSRAGALGTIGIVAPRALAAEIRRARARAPGRPIAANLLVPFARRAHVEACIAEGARAVVLFCGFAPRSVARLRAAGIVVVHQVGTPDEARRAVDDGADALIVQGREAGGHLVGVEPSRAALARVRAALPDTPLLVAGGIATADDVRAAIAAGAQGVACGSRFLLTEESRAHPLYKARALGATRTLETRLFSMGWPLRHRVVPNAATDRWCARDPRGPLVARIAAHAGVPLARLLPIGAGSAITARQRLSVPIYSPSSPLAGDDDRTIEVAPLYAGESVARMTRVVSAEEAVRDLARGLS